ncbi:hypothetical protein NHJ13734_003338 [Beauveria thailandica]
MLFHNLLFLLPAALLSSAAPADLHSLADAGPPPPLDSSPPGVLSSTVDEASADSAASASPCSPWYPLYGRGGWTYTEVQWCFRQRGDQTVVTQEQQNPWYFWGGAWYTGKRHTLRWQAMGTAGSSWYIDTGNNFNDGPVRKDIHTFKTKIPPGIYAVSIYYSQLGPWWGADAAIDADLAFAILLGN